MTVSLQSIGNDSIDGGAGIDTYDASGQNKGTIISLADQVAIFDEPYVTRIYTEK